MSLHWRASGFLFLRVILITLCAAPSVSCVFTCQQNCTCFKTAVKCIKKNLRAVPNWIPHTVRILDLSDNPALQVEHDSFAKFTSLRSLYLSGCNIKNSLELPRGLKGVDLSYNSLSLENVRETFASNVGSLLSNINLRSNGLRLEGNFSVFPKSVEYLRLDGNTLTEVQKDDFKNLTKLRYLNLGSNKLHSIAPGAFDSLNKLRRVILEKNNINELPKRLFRNSPHIQYLVLDENKLTHVPDLTGTRFLNYLTLVRNRIKTVDGYSIGNQGAYHIDLASNEIESFNFSGIRFLKLDLSNNRINKIEKKAFGKNPQLIALLLQRNNISYLTDESFQGIHYVNELHLQRNNLQKLKKGLFRNMSIIKLLLFNNHITEMAGILDGMQSQPTLLLLFGNPGLRYLKTADYQYMKNGSRIYIGCTAFKKFSTPLILKAEVICSPTANLVIDAGTSGLKGNGFLCVGNEPVKCYPCKPGEYDEAVDHAGFNNCANCPPGAFYQDEMASISCKSCPLGQYVPPERAPGKSPLECLTCPQGTNTNTSAGYRACHCLPGYSRTYRFGGCSKCTQNGFKCERDYPEMRQGFWMSWVNMASCKSAFKSFMSNLNTRDDSYDRVTSHFTCSLPVAHTCPMPGSCKGGVDASCNAGYSGVLCAVCQSGYMKQFNKCVPCPSPAVSVIQSAAYFVIFVILCWLMSIMDKITLAGKNNEADKRTFADLIQSSLKILMGFYQVLVRIINAFSYIQWPSTLSHAMKVFEFIQFSILRIPSLHCIRSDWRLNAVLEFWVSLLACAIVPTLILIYFAVQSAFAYRRFSTEEFRRKCKVRGKNCLQAVVLFFFATYPFISTKIFHVLPASCHTFCVAEKEDRCLHEMAYLRNDYSVECAGKNSVRNFSVGYAYVSLLLPIGLPCLLLYLLWRFSPKVNKAMSQGTRPRLLAKTDYIETDDDEPEMNECRAAEGTSVVAVALKMTYGNYKKSCWYWEFVEMIRKLSTVIASSFLLQNVKIGLFGNILLSIVFIVLHAKKWPMKDSFDNYAQLLALVSVTINLSYSVTRTSSIGDADIIEEGRDVFALGLLLVSLDSLLIILIAGRFIKEIAMKIFTNLKGFTCCCRCADCYSQCAEHRIRSNEQPLL